MTTSMLTYRRVAVALIAASLMAVACKKSAVWPTTPTTIVVHYEAGERVAGEAANGFVQASRSVLTVAQSRTATVVSGATAQADGVLALPSCPGATIRYFNAQGQEQTAYNPNTTTRVTAVGTCTGSANQISVDLVLDDAQASSPSFLVNGTAQGIYQGSAAVGTLTNVRIPKQDCMAPLSGDMTVRVDQINIALHFNGSPSVTGTYVTGGQTITFTVPVPGC
jgi:hypothetical protein